MRAGGCVGSRGDKFRRWDTASPSCYRGCWPSQSQRLPRELRSLIARTIPFRVTYGNGPWNQRKNTNLISTVGREQEAVWSACSPCRLENSVLLRDQRATLSIAHLIPLTILNKYCFNKYHRLNEMYLEICTIYILFQLYIAFTRSGINFQRLASSCPKLM